MLGLLQAIQERGGIPTDGSQEQTQLRLTGLVVPRYGHIIKPFCCHGKWLLHIRCYCSVNASCSVSCGAVRGNAASAMDKPAIAIART